MLSGIVQRLFLIQVPIGFFYFSPFKIFSLLIRLPVQRETMSMSMAEQRKQNIIQTVRDYGKRLFSFIRGKVNTDEDAEDILQEVWYQFTNVMNSQPVEQTGAWLFRVARNRIIDQYRRHRPVSLEDEMDSGKEEEFHFKEFLLAERSTPETEHLRNLFWEELFTALNELPEDQRQVFIWNELEDISFQQIAERTGEKINTLISRKRYAVLHLRQRLEQLYVEIIKH